MNRRALLSTLGAAALPLAGCLDADGGTGAASDTPNATEPNTDAPPTETPAAESLSVGGGTHVTDVGFVRVDDVAVQRSVVHHHLWREHYEPADAQFLVVNASVPDESDLSFGVELDGERVEVVERVMLHHDGSRRALAVHPRTADEAALVFDTSHEPRWELGRSAVERLAAAPEFHLLEAALVEVDGETALRLDVENRGDRDGTFRGVVVSDQHADADAEFSFLVAEGEQTTELVFDRIVAAWAPDDEFIHDVTPRTRRFSVGNA